MTTAIPIHMAAMFHVDHVRRDGPAGARSRLKYGESATWRSISSTSASLLTARSSRLTTLRSSSLASSVTLGMRTPFPSVDDGGYLPDGHDIL